MSQHKIATVHDIEQLAASCHHISLSLTLTPTDMSLGEILNWFKCCIPEHKQM